MIECSLDKITWEQMHDDDCFFSSSEIFAENHDCKDGSIVYSKNGDDIRTYKIFVDEIGSVSYYNAIQIKE